MLKCDYLYGKPGYRQIDKPNSKTSSKCQQHALAHTLRLGSQGHSRILHSLLAFQKKYGRLKIFLANTLVDFLLRL